MRPEKAIYDKPARASEPETATLSRTQKKKAQQVMPESMYQLSLAGADFDAITSSSKNSPL